MLLSNNNHALQQLAARPHPRLLIPTFQERFQMTRFNQPLSLFARLADFRRLLPIALAAGLAVTLPVQAETAPQPQDTSPAAAPDSGKQTQATPPAMTPEQSKQMEEIKNVHAEYMGLQKRIMEIQQETLKSHPELEKEEQSLRDLVLAKMSSTGKSAKDDMEEIIKLEEKLRSGETPAEERETLMRDYQTKAVAFRKAQSEAMNNPEVQAAQKKLMGDIMTAMKEKDPQVEKLMQEMQEKQQQLAQMIKASGHMQ
jgi:predicted RNA binding protein with dsRBD fold (UPF0201 family)